MNKTISCIAKFGLVLLLLAGLLPMRLAMAVSGNISDSNKYAWSENTGWNNFMPSDGGVTVNAAYLSGYAWTENSGYIKLGNDNGGPYSNTSSTDWGVNHDNGSGNLSGYAWSENGGWINFNPTHREVTIDPSTGSFDGYAWAENVGWIHFESSWPSIPTLSEWGMIIFTILLGMMGVYYLKRLKAEV